MTKHVKISLSGARDIPFSALVLSQANVRRVKAGVSIDSLAADIERRGLLASLTVRAQRDDEGNETGKFEVPAGGRRYRALQKLVKQRRLAKTEPVPCIVRDDDMVSAEEDSLAENVHREPLHPLDQFYERFGLNDRQVEILSRATPKRDYYCQSRRGNRLFDLGLGEVALAFTAASSKTDQTRIGELFAAHGRAGFAAAWLSHRKLEWAAELLPTIAVPNQESPQ